ncbi:UNVERIFIED_CONTAM: Exopolygalacturonase [Sesamum calycinum]|uniref:Exopolygalacturonase n=1 Tax=Sesamum calycinum TaxID=2727403 RepID=A0AAW2JLP7_9LAMI
MAAAPFERSDDEVAPAKTGNDNLGGDAFLDAWKSACEADGGVVSVPQGMFLVSGAAFEGPCNGQTGFSVDGTVVATDDPTIDQDYWITFHKVDGLTVSGYGVFDGNGASSSSSCKGVKECNPLPPMVIDSLIS